MDGWRARARAIAAQARSRRPRRPSQAARRGGHGGGDAEQAALAGLRGIWRSNRTDHDSQDDPDASRPPFAGHAAHASDRPEETAAEPEPRLITAVRDRLRLAVAAARQADTQTTITIIGEAERRGLSSNELLAVAERHGPNPGAYPSPAGRAALAGRLRPLGVDHRPRRQALDEQER